LNRLKPFTRRQFWWKKLMKRHLVNTSHTLEELGEGYGGWVVPTDMIQSDWVIYSLGIGEDITFDVDLMERLGCTVYGFDPTPRAIAYAQTQREQYPNFKFYPYGVWSEDTDVKFYNPRKKHFASYSILNLRHQEDYIMAEVKTIKTLMRELGHDHVDLIKMDVEGAEQKIIPNLIADKIQTKVLCVEYDQPVETFSRLAWQCFTQSIRLTRRLKQAGYHLVCVEGLTATYLHERVL
jgi:FkbM family methyltransferase